MTGHPETVDPLWFQELVRRAAEREMRRLALAGIDIETAWQEAMWYAFDIRSNLTGLYQAGAAEESS